MQLETNRTIFRSFLASDLNDLHEFHSDPEVMKYIVGGVRKNKAESLNDLMKYINHEQTFGFGKWAIIHKQTRAFMGRAGLVNIEQTNEVDFGYAFHQKFWSQGYATEIAQAMLAYYQQHLTSRPLIGLVKTNNVASANVLSKVGFKAAGVGNYFGENFDIYRL